MYQKALFRSKGNRVNDFCLQNWFEWFNFFPIVYDWALKLTIQLKDFCWTTQSATPVTVEAAFDWFSMTWSVYLCCGSRCYIVTVQIFFVELVNIDRFIINENLQIKSWSGLRRHTGDLSTFKFCWKNQFRKEGWTPWKEERFL